MMRDIQKILKIYMNFIHFLSNSNDAIDYFNDEDEEEKL